ncbi:MAG: 2-C-methyl-D-erythritol 4-phosphate cytidylyltransferase [Oscillospiraceae bacterium]|nr:2-C-methyl-D-erythritol 4-phosphate cytidylyltransferase [Oscillospiraceae bacterium]
MKVSGIIAAAGSGTRMNAGMNKVFMNIAGIPMLAHTLRSFEEADIIDDIIIVTGRSDISEAERIAEEYNISKLKNVVEGGRTRQRSVLNGLYASDADIAAVHDGARALITAEIITRTVLDAKKYGAAAAGVKCTDSLKRAENGFIRETVERENVYNIQTPQVFFRDKLIIWHEKAARDNMNVTDDTALAVENGARVFITESCYENIKITTPSDTAAAEAILKRRNDNAYRTGL